MAEYIERTALLKKLKRSGAICDFGEHLIEQFPAADVASVVYCKDCEHAFINGFGNESGVVLCKLLSSCENVAQAVRQFDDFCSHGKRKEDA